VSADVSSQLAERLYDAYNRHDAAAAAALYSESGRHREIAQERARSGRREVEDGLAHFLASFPDAHWQAEHRFATAEGVAIAYRLTGTLQRKLGPFEPQGQQLDLCGVHVLAIENGEIVRCDDYWDAATLGRQMSAAR
jgi:steroid delta-isomerase-like uncharacterized protein